MKTYSNEAENAERWEKVASHSDHDKAQRRATHVMSVPGGLLYQVTLEQGQHAPAIALAFVPVGDEVPVGDVAPVGDETPVGSVGDGSIAVIGTAGTHEVIPGAAPLSVGDGLPNVAAEAPRRGCQPKDKE